MPTYEYACPEGHQFEVFQRISDRPRTKCPVCGKTAQRLISGGAGLIFKGSGFYITDYGKDGKGPRKEPGGEAKPATGEAKAETTPAPATEPEAKSEPAKKKKAGS